MWLSGIVCEIIYEIVYEIYIDERYIVQATFVRRLMKTMNLTA